MKKEVRYTTLTIKKELKDKMDEKIGEMGLKMTYSQLINSLIQFHTNKNNK